MVRNRLTRWLWTPVLEGPWALVSGLAAIALPTVVRLAVNGSVVGCEFTPYLPFVLLSAILLGTRPAVGVALGSVPVVGGLFAGPMSNFLAEVCAISAAAVFLCSSAIVIGVVALIRLAVSALQSRGADETAGGIVFSLDRGQVWASWYGQDPPVLLGSQRKVSEMMQDFLAQVELGKRLNGISD